MIYRLTAFLLLVLACGCSCPGTRRPESAGAGETPAGAPAQVQQNFSYVEGVIDSVLAVGAEPTLLLITVTSARAGSGRASMVETGSQLTVTPQSERNAKIPEFLLHPTRGAKFAGSLTRADDGHWILLDAKAR